MSEPDKTPEETEKYLTPEELIQRYRGKISLRTLDNWRSSGKGPHFTRVGWRILYPLSKVLDYEKRHTLKMASGVP